MFRRAWSGRVFEEAMVLSHRNRKRQGQESTLQISLFATQNWWCALGDSACPDSFGVCPCVALHPGALLGLARVWWIHRDASDFFHGPLRPLPDQHRRGLFQQALHRSPWFCTMLPPASGAFFRFRRDPGRSLGSRALHWLVDLVGYDLVLRNFRHGADGFPVCFGVETVETCKTKRQSPRFGHLRFDNLSDPSRWVLLRGDHVSAFGQRLHSSVLVVCRSLLGLDQPRRICDMGCGGQNVWWLNSFEPFDDTQSCQNRKRIVASPFALCQLTSEDRIPSWVETPWPPRNVWCNKSWKSRCRTLLWKIHHGCGSFPNGPGKPRISTVFWCLMFFLFLLDVPSKEHLSMHLMGFNSSPSDTWEILGILEEDMWYYCFTPQHRALLEKQWEFNKKRRNDNENYIIYNNDTSILWW